ncbi:hypothetical protein [Bacillus sp. ISL-57]|uniref:hypothetical protein n=1 Tax=Bacillus sp. ISL-57 TaxID=2819135 RepID=UPI001BEC521D|nr:hypothetical protein [Bacillus sp. ISL-57]
MNFGTNIMKHAMTNANASACSLVTLLSASFLAIMLLIGSASCKDSSADKFQTSIPGRLAMIPDTVRSSICTCVASAFLAAAFFLAGAFFFGAAGLSSPGMEIDVAFGSFTLAS